MPDFLIILIVGKTLLDLRMHLREHGLSWRVLTGTGESVAASPV